MKKLIKIQIYFYLILVVSIIWILVLPKPIKNFAPIFFGFLTFPVFGFSYYNNLFEFSNIFKKEHPKLFQKHVVDYGFSLKGKVVQIGLFTKINDFEQLKNSELYEKYVLCKQFLELTLASFLIFGTLGIATVYLE